MVRFAKGKFNFIAKMGHKTRFGTGTQQIYTDFQQIFWKKLVFRFENVFYEDLISVFHVLMIKDGLTVNGKSDISRTEWYQFLDIGKGNTEYHVEKMVLLIQLFEGYMISHAAKLKHMMKEDTLIRKTQLEFVNKFFIHVFEM